MCKIKITPKITERLLEIFGDGPNDDSRKIIAQTMLVLTKSHALLFWKRIGGL